MYQCIDQKYDSVSRHNETNLSILWQKNTTRLVSFFGNLVKNNQVNRHIFDLGPDTRAFRMFLMTMLVGNPKTIKKLSRPTKHRIQQPYWAEVSCGQGCQHFISRMMISASWIAAQCWYFGVAPGEQSQIIHIWRLIRSSYSRITDSMLASTCPPVALPVGLFSV